MHCHPQKKLTFGGGFHVLLASATKDFGPKDCGPNYG
jgi:hypothetical protein